MTTTAKPDVTIPDGTATERAPGRGPHGRRRRRGHRRDAASQVHYVGVSWSTGQQFDASWDRGQEFGFGLGAGQVISGWDQGVQGMRVGGRRRLTIPPHLGYGDRALVG